jgi:hypothetical protein
MSCVGSAALWHMRQLQGAAADGASRAYESGADGGGQIPQMVNRRLGNALLPLRSPSVSVTRNGRNAFGATPSASVFVNPIVPSLAIHGSRRGAQSRWRPWSPHRIGPRRRPRLTPNPVIVTREGDPYLAIGTPGTNGHPPGHAAGAPRHGGTRRARAPRPSRAGRAGGVSRDGWRLRHPSRSRDGRADGRGRSASGVVHGRLLRAAVRVLPDPDEEATSALADTETLRASGRRRRQWLPPGSEPWPATPNAAAGRGCARTTPPRLPTARPTARPRWRRGRRSCRGWGWGGRPRGRR